MIKFNLALHRKHLRVCLTYLTGLLLSCAAANVFAVVVLQYHHVDNKTPPSTSISSELFEKHLAFIEENGYQVWSLVDVISHLKASKPIPDKVVSITFDDAYESIYQAAYPLLKKRQWPFTVFVATEPVENRLNTFISWAELREMSDYGATIANHTHSHAHLVRRNSEETEAEWLERVRDEITLAERLIQQHVGKAEKLFAYPYGEYTKEIRTLLTDLGYTAFGQQSGAIGPGMAMTALPRFPMTDRFGAMAQFETKIASLPMATKTVKPDVKIVMGDELAEGLNIQFTAKYNAISCFFEGKPLELKQSNNEVLIKQMPDLPVGRSRINCTAASEQKQRFHWFSHAWIKPNSDGSWYAEH